MFELKFKKKKLNLRILIERFPPFAVVPSVGQR